MNDPLFSRPWWRAFGFRLFGAVAKPHRNRWSPLPAHPKRILVLLPVLRGDYLIATPLLEALSHARPQAIIAVCVTSASFDLSVVDPYVDHVILYEKLPYWPRSVWEIIRYHPDIVVFPKGHPATTESLLMVLSGAPYRVGLSHPHHDALLTHPITHDWENEHRTEAFARLVQPFGMDPSGVTRRLHVGVDPNAESWAEKVFSNLPPMRPRVAVNISAGQPSRVWPPEMWGQVVQKLSEALPEAGFIYISSPGDVPVCKELVERNKRAFSFPTNSLLEAAAVVARCTALITVDTGTVQIGVARNVPQVVLYSGDHSEYTHFAPESVRNRCILAPLGSRITSITPDMVVENALSLLQEISSS